MTPPAPGRPPPVSGPAVVEVRGALGRAGALELCNHLTALLRLGSVECRLLGAPDLPVLDALARMRLLAQRLGTTFLVTGNDEGLLALTGLEVLRQPEACEQPGVQEVVDVPDPAL